MDTAELDRSVLTKSIEVEERRKADAEEVTDTGEYEPTTLSGGIKSDTLTDTGANSRRSLGEEVEARANGIHAIEVRRKRCPTCDRTFNDNWLTFCTDDGTTLVDVRVIGELTDQLGSRNGPPPPPGSWAPLAPVQFAAPQPTAVAKPRALRREYDVKLTFPRKVYERSSRSVTVIITRGLLTRAAKGLSVIEENGNTRIVAVAQATSGEFEVELQSPKSIDVRGSATQRKKIGPETLVFSWNCYFAEEGDYELTVLIRLSSRGRVADLGAPLTERVKVYKKFGLPKRVIAIISRALGLMGSALAVVEAAQKIRGR